MVVDILGMLVGIKSFSADPRFLALKHSFIIRLTISVMQDTLLLTKVQLRQRSLTISVESSFSLEIIMGTRRIDAAQNVPRDLIWRLLWSSTSPTELQPMLVNMGLLDFAEGRNGALFINHQ